MEVAGPVGAAPEPDWRVVVLTSRGILRWVPEGVRNLWFETLTEELDRLLAAPSVARYLRLQAFVRIILAPLPRSGKKHLIQATRLIRVRLTRWVAREFDGLRGEFLAAAALPLPGQAGRRKGKGTQCEETFIPDAPRRAILRAVREGDVSKAAKLVDAVWGEADLEVAKAKLPELYPAGTPLQPIPWEQHVQEDFSVEELRKALNTFPKGSSGGLGGLMPVHCRGSGPMYDKFLTSLAALASSFAWHRLPRGVCALIAGAKLVFLPKSDGGIRPIAVGELVRRLAGKMLVSRYQKQVADLLQPHQLGVAAPLGLERIVHGVQLWAASGRHDEIVAQVDLKNAFGCVSRQAFMAAVETLCPMFLPYVAACYESPTLAWAAAGLSAQVSCGVHQGDPLSPLLFALGIQASIASVAPLVRHSWWYLDDGTLIGTPDQVAAAMGQLASSLAAVGLTINVSKSFIWMPAPLVLPRGLEGLPIRGPHEGLVVLGTPVGHPDFVLGKVQLKAQHMEEVFARLASLSHKESECQILRACLGPCKIVHLLRTVDAPAARWLASDIGGRLRDAWALLLGISMSDGQWALSSLPASLGGLGVNDPRSWWKAAQVSSWVACAPFVHQFAGVPAGVVQAVRELAVEAPSLGGPLQVCVLSKGWPLPADQGFCAQWGHQFAWADLLHRKAVEQFETDAPPRLVDLRVAQTAPHSSDWLQVSPDDVIEEPLSNAEWQALLRFRVGAPISGKRVCAACAQPMTCDGDHALSCAAGGFYRRHNKVRDLFASLCREAGWHTQVEVSLPSEGVPSALRPADILLPSVGQCPVALDIGVSHPLRPSAGLPVRSVLGESAERHERDKARQMEAECRRYSWVYRPICFETTGAWGPGAVVQVRRIVKALASREGSMPLDVMHSVGHRVSRAVAKGCAEMLVRCCL